MSLAVDVGLPRTNSGRRKKTAVRMNKLKRPKRSEPGAMLWYKSNKTQSENEKVKRNHKASRSNEMRLKRKRKKRVYEKALDGLIT